ncbi:MAG: phosphatidylserine decarboxylase [Spirochaetes bacterium]|nr:MAG: phosphatidylserine decarboxylase [Spirochaetota bacterium]
MSRSRSLAIFLFRITPTGLLSRLFGCAARIPLPSWALSPIIDWYARKYGVLTGEIRPGSRFRTLDAFFTRELAEGARVADPAKNAVVSPVDARVDMYGAIDEARILQAKGVDYSLADLVPSDMHRHYLNGLFMTLYLAPGDYHRIHSPVSGRIAGYHAIPGRLYTVQEYMVKGLPGLFSINERLISHIKTERGMVAVCKIGAMNVGRITLAYAEECTNRTLRRARETRFPEGDGPAIEKGAELGAFHLGSTVILLFPAGAVKFEDIAPGMKVKMGQKIARFS